MHIVQLNDDLMHLDGFSDSYKSTPLIMSACCFSRYLERASCNIRYDLILSSFLQHK